MSRIYLSYLRIYLSYLLQSKWQSNSLFSCSVFVRRLPRGWVEVIADCVVELTGDVWVVDGLFASLLYVFGSVVYIRLCTSVL